MPVVLADFEVLVDRSDISGDREVKQQVSEARITISFHSVGSGIPLWLRDRADSRNRRCAMSRTPKTALHVDDLAADASHILLRSAMCLSPIQPSVKDR